MANLGMWQTRKTRTMQTRTTARFSSLFMLSLLFAKCRVKNRISIKRKLTNFNKS